MTKKNKLKVFDGVKERVERSIAEASKEENILAHYNDCKENPNNLSYWFPKVVEGLNKTDVNIVLPRTHVEEFPYSEYKAFRAGNFTLDSALVLEDYFTTKAGHFIDTLGDEYFIKTGLYSDKFMFSNPHVKRGDSLGIKIQDIMHNAMAVGAPFSPEVVFREFIPSSEDTIYEGMPLRTEFRVFYDFDEKKAIGVANYWHPKYMEGSGRLTERDSEVYASNKARINDTFDILKTGVVHDVSSLCDNIDLQGKWSVDIMFDNGTFWLIDMALMNQSALVDVMEPVSSNRTKV